MDQLGDHLNTSVNVSGDLPSGPLCGAHREAIRNELAKILASQTFRLAEGQRASLRYAVEEALAGRGDLLKEYTIGTEAFGRNESFDQRLDPIVRTQARKLRARLSKYFESEGINDPVRIEFPKGSYAPAFRISSLPHPAPDSAPATADEEDQGSISPPAYNTAGFRRKTAVIFLAILGLIYSGAAALFMAYPGFQHDISRPAKRSVTVMPFRNAGGDQSDEFLKDGLSDDLIDSLAQVPGFQVVAPTSAFYLKGKPVNAPKTGRRLKVGAILEGGFLRFGNRLQVTAQLKDAENGYRLWTGSYERELNDIAEINREISQSVTSALGSQPANTGGSDSPVAAHPVSPSREAYQDYLKGRYSWNKLNARSLQTAIRYFQQAIAKDPSFARAYAALADSYVMAPQVATVRPSEIVSKIKATASKALALDPSLGEAHFDLAISAEYEYDWGTAELEFKKGLQLSPGSAVGHLWYAKLLALRGRKAEVLVERNRAAELDPLSPYALQSVGGYLSVMGRYDDAIDKFETVLELEPNFGLARQGLGVAYVLKGVPERGIAELRAACEQMSGPRRKALLGYAYAISGRTNQAREILNDFLGQSDGSLPALAVAQIYIGLGDNDRAFLWLDKAIDEKDLDMTLQWDSIYEPLRSDRRFSALLRKMKLT